MTQQQRNGDMVDQVYLALVNAPTGLECSINQVLAALGMMASGILSEGFTDPAVRQQRTDAFCKALQVCIHRTMRAELTLN
jgi:hypothetical protein